MTAAAVSIDINNSSLESRMEQNIKAFTSKRVLIDGALHHVALIVNNGKIVKIVPVDKEDKYHVDDCVDIDLVDAGNDVIMPGIVDAHVHVNEPGRTAWEGYYTATRAAAVGGVTTIVDMPLNSIPSTVTLDAFKEKVKQAEHQCHVDVAFWGGIVPNNQHELIPMMNAGVMGFKCFLIHSGVDDFPHVVKADLEKAFRLLQGTSGTVLFHAEVDCNCGTGSGNKEEYRTFLETRPEIMEEEAIKLVCEMCLKYKVKCHIVHLSAASALPLIKSAREQGAPLTVETCHHYLSLEAETVPNGNTLYKCCPPIREKKNQNLLWEALKSGHIDMVVSDHSPCTPNLKLLDKGDFLTAWGGIASVQFGLHLFWTNCQRHGMDIFDLTRLLSQKTASLANLDHRKGLIKPGYDADLVIWDPDAEFEVTRDKIQFKNKVSPYLGKRLRGVVKKTILRGEIVYSEGQLSPDIKGCLLYNEKTQLPSHLL